MTAFQSAGQGASGLVSILSADPGIVNALQSGKAGGVFLRDPSALRDFYSAHGDKPFWSEKQADGALKILTNAWQQGLNPKAYHAGEIAALKGSSADDDKAAFDLLLTDGVVRYARDMTGFRWPPVAVDVDAGFWRKPMPAAQALDAIGKSDPAGFLAGLVPKDTLYIRMRDELIRLVESPDRAAEAYLPLSFGGMTLRPGDVSRDVPKLRGRMGLSYNSANGEEHKYDDDLAAAVMKFQRENGLESDGYIGPKTLALLNQTSDAKIEQLAANMERLRWLDDAKPDRYVLVNIPSQTLWAVDQGHVAFQMAVIVGRPERATKNFVAEITGVRFNPKWIVPPTIKIKDILPKMISDPEYLTSKGIEVSYLVDGQRETVDPASIDWEHLTIPELLQLRMVQGEGDNNALGHIRVLMDNQYDIYMHDTNEPEYFSKKIRMLSSGCIRMSNPEEMARFILADNPGWSDEKMKALIAAGKTVDVGAKDKMPVYIVYQSVWLDESSHIIYGPDPYKRDQKLLAAMKARGELYIPESSDKNSINKNSINIGLNSNKD